MYIVTVKATTHGTVLMLQKVQLYSLLQLGHEILEALHLLIDDCSSQDNFLHELGSSIFQK